MLAVNTYNATQSASNTNLFPFDRGIVVHSTLDLTDVGKNKQKKKKIKQKVRLNISGKIFETYMKTLKSKDGSIFRMMEVYDFYDTKKEEFYFDRNSEAFESIFVYLQSGLLRRPEKVAFKIFIEELQYFGFHDLALRLYTENNVNGKVITGEKVQETTMTPRKYVWNLFEEPDFNTLSRIIACLVTFIIFFSIALFCVETLPQLSGKKEAYVLSRLEMFCVIWFTIELSVRFIVSYRKTRFFFDLMNIIDLVSILPFYVAMTIDSKQSLSLAVLRVLRMVRLFRVFKLYRYSKAIHLIIHTIRSSMRELILLGVFLMLLVILFSACLYFFESADANMKQTFQSIPDTFWICIVTLTTVGYGDYTPVTLGGRLVASLLAITGVITIALPIPIVVSNFARHCEFIMSDGPAYRFDFDERISFHLKNKVGSSVDDEDRETRL